MMTKKRARQRAGKVHFLKGGATPIWKRGNLKTVSKKLQYSNVWAKTKSYISLDWNGDNFKKGKERSSNAEIVFDEWAC